MFANNLAFLKPVGLRQIDTILNPQTSFIYIDWILLS